MRAILPFAGLAVAVAAAAEPAIREGLHPDVTDFAAGTEINVHSVEARDPAELNARLVEARASGLVWADHPVLAAVRLCAEEPVGRSASVEAEFEPRERDAGAPIRKARVVVEDLGWADDSVAGVRFVLYLAHDAAGNLVVERALRATLCARPYRRFWSATPCP